MEVVAAGQRDNHLGATQLALTHGADDASTTKKQQQQQRRRVLPSVECWHLRAAQLALAHRADDAAAAATAAEREGVQSDVGISGQPSSQ
jgi:hypothetical protein